MPRANFLLGTALVLKSMLEAMREQPLKVWSQYYKAVSEERNNNLTRQRHIYLADASGG